MMLQIIEEGIIEYDIYFPVFENNLSKDYKKRGNRKIQIEEES